MYHASITTTVNLQLKMDVYQSSYVIYQDYIAFDTRRVHEYEGVIFNSKNTQVVNQNKQMKSMYTFGNGLILDSTQVKKKNHNI